MDCINFIVQTNPCGCGYYPDLDKCTCTPAVIQRHLQKISRPLLDRIDLCVEAPRIKMDELLQKRKNESSREIRERVERAQNLQRARYKALAFSSNSRLSADGIEQFCPMEKGARDSILWAYEKLDLSARAYYKIIRVSRTIADLEESAVIREPHMREALLFRSMDEKLWRKIQ